MEPLVEVPPILEDLCMTLRFLQHVYFLNEALRALVIDSDPRAPCLLAASTLNAVRVVRPSSRSFRASSIRTTYSLISWTGRSLETAYYVQWTLHRTNMAACLILLVLPLAVYIFWFQSASIRSTCWRSLFLFANRLSLAVWLTFSLSISIYRLGFLLSLFYIALALTSVFALIALYRYMCAFQTRFVSARIRLARGPDGNSWNPAARLPAEVQLHIFHLLRTSGRFGAHEYLPREIDERRSVLPSGTPKYLAAAARTCAAWNAAATEALYHDAFPNSDRGVRALARTLAARPALAQLVRRIALPQWERYTPDSPVGSWWGDFCAAIEFIISRCVHATDVRLFRDKTPLLDDIPGIRSGAQHISHLAIHGFVVYCSPWNRVHEHEEVDLLVLLDLLPRLQSLSLSAQNVLFDPTTLSDSQRLALSRIDTLSLASCTVDMQHLIRLLQLLPRLRVVELRNLDLSDTGGKVRATDLFSTQHRTLVELRFLADGTIPGPMPTITLRTLGAFVALRTLAVGMHMLCQISPLPPNLVELVLSFPPYSCKARHNRTGHDWRQNIYYAVHNVSMVAPTAPGLRSVQLWDIVAPVQLADWSIAAFMLREMLARAGIAVAVNLFIEHRYSMRLKSKFSQRKVVRRLFWMDS